MSYRRAVLAQRLALLVVSGLLGVGCGRLGFESLDRGDLPDGGTSDAIELDVPFDPMTLTGCSQAPPFLHLIDVVMPGNPSTQFARYCYAGLTGPLFASVLYGTDEDVFFATTVPITDGVVALSFGSTGCTACFVRLLANGVVADGPTTDFAGD